MGNMKPKEVNSHMPKVNQSVGKYQLWGFFFFFFLMFLFERERDRQSVSREGQREEDTESEACSKLRVVSTEPNTGGLNPQTVRP